MATVFVPNLLLGKRIVVAGATSGLGWALAKAVASAGAEVWAVGRSEEKLDALLDALPTGAEPVKHQRVVGDLSTFDGSVAAFKAVQDQAQGVDGVFYSAGMEIIKPTRALKAQDVDQALGAALLGALGAAKCCASKRFWRQTGPQTDGGSLVFMSSVSAHAGQPGMAAYGAARAGVLGLVRNLAVELAPLNVRVNALTSGAVSTPMHDRITSRLSDIGAAAYNQAHPLGIGQPQDITEISLLLLSAAGAWITGADLIVDGGFLA